MALFVFLVQVHPDLFGNFPVLQEKNAHALQTLMSMLDEVRFAVCIVCVLLFVSVSMPRSRPSRTPLVSSLHPSRCMLSSSQRQRRKLLPMRELAGDAALRLPPCVCPQGGPLPAHARALPADR